MTEVETLKAEVAELKGEVLALRKDMRAILNAGIVTRGSLQRTLAERDASLRIARQVELSRRA